ncbi:MAG: hypothetical protein M1831_006106 [Alyxoria varia]|nr:MAG: hypothetical protein M1831_006106 [Alyxoria varia]
MVYQFPPNFGGPAAGPNYNTIIRSSHVPEDRLRNIRDCSAYYGHHIYKFHSDVFDIDLERLPDADDALSAVRKAIEDRLGREWPTFQQSGERVGKVQIHFVDAGLTHPTLTKNNAEKWLCGLTRRRVLNAYLEFHLESKDVEKQEKAPESENSSDSESSPDQEKGVDQDKASDRDKGPSRDKQEVKD